jgi:hypothetical protein
LNGTVAFDDGDFEKSIPIGRMVPEITKGCHVVAEWEGLGAWRAAKVIRVHAYALFDGEQSTRMIVFDKETEYCAVDCSSI